MDPISLTLSQQFELQKFSNIIDNTDDRDKLKSVAKQLLQAYMNQKAATTWALRQSLTPTNILVPQKETTDG